MNKDQLLVSTPPHLRRGDLVTLYRPEQGFGAGLRFVIFGFRSDGSVEAHPAPDGQPVGRYHVFHRDAFTPPEPVQPLRFGVKVFRDAGLEAKWGRIEGKPFIFLRDPKSSLLHQRTKWWACTRELWATAVACGDVKQAFDQATLTGNHFYL
jgi:hypothetical protein